MTTIADMIRHDGREPGGTPKESPTAYLRIPATATILDLVKHGVIGISFEKAGK